MRKYFLCIVIFIIYFETIVFSADTKKLYNQTVGSIVALTVENSDGICTGTGFFAIQPNIIATCYHVVEGATHITARDSRGNEYIIEGIIDYSESMDIAILKSSKSGKMLALDANMPSPGTNVYALGNPMGLNFSFTNGMVSQIQNFDGINVIQFTSPVSPGNSGGPIIDENGKALGVVSFGFIKGQNLNFAIPVAMLYTLNKNNPIYNKEIVEKNNGETNNNDIDNNGNIVKAIQFARDLYDKKMYVPAKMELLKALEYDPTNTDIILFLDEVNKRLAEVDNYQKITEIEKYFTKGNDYFKASKYIEALNEFQKALNIDPKNIKIICVMAVTYRLNGQYILAKSYSEKGLNLFNDNNIQDNKTLTRFYETLAECYKYEKNYYKALEMQNKVIELFPNSFNYEGLGIIYERLGNKKEAKNIYNKALEICEDKDLKQRLKKTIRRCR